jgi:4-amino-4-deoxy-L-arabinose transferase-like glycosyltransferase
MATPWWYTKYYPINSESDAFYDANPSIDQHTGLFDRTNCFIDGSCITGGQIYKNNTSLQWVYTATLVLMILAWLPWLLFVHLLHFRADKNRTPMKGRRTLMVISALLTWLLILAAVIVFAAGIVKSNGVYNSGGLYGHKQVLYQNGLTGIGNDIDDKGRDNKRQAPYNTNDFGAGAFGYNGLQSARDRSNIYYAPVAFGSLPYGDDSMSVLGAGIPLVYNAANTTTFVGDLGYKWGAHAAWYFAIFTLALIPLALLLGLAIKQSERVVTTTRTVERSVTTQPAVVGQPMGYQQPAMHEQLVQPVVQNRAF